MAMKAAMEVLPGFNALDPYAAPPLEPRKQQLFDQFKPREELWSTLENKIWFEPEERWTRTWNSKFAKRVRRMARWWMPIPVLKVTETTTLRSHRAFCPIPSSD